MNPFGKHTQVIHFDNKTKSIIRNIVKVEMQTMLHLLTDKGRWYIFNTDRILFTEIIEDK